MTQIRSPRWAFSAERLHAGESLGLAGVLFDMDGTLIDSTAAVEESWRLWAHSLGVATPGPEFHGRTARDLVGRAGVPAADRPAAEQLLEDIEARPGQVVATMPGVTAALQALQPGCWGIVTSATRRVALSRLDAAGLPRPAVLITGDDVIEGKPAAEPFLAGIRGLSSTSPQRPWDAAAPVLCIEDSAAGLRAATAAGGLALGVASDPMERERLAPLADFTLSSLAELDFAGDLARLAVQLRA